MANQEGRVTFWDMDSWKPVHVVKKHKKAITSLTTDPNNILGFTSSDQTLICWDLAEMKFKFSYQFEHGTVL